MASNLLKSVPKLMIASSKVSKNLDFWLLNKNFRNLMPPQEIQTFKILVLKPQNLHKAVQYT